MTVITLYGKPGCHLCDDARVLLERVRDELGFELVQCDITTDDALHLAYLERIPVTVIDGVEAFELDELDEAALRLRIGPETSA